jgi:nucleotide-binding universal stress UspA family protein
MSSIPTEAQATKDIGANGRPIVVGIDGSPGAVAALKWAAVEARAHGWPLTVVYAYDPMTYYYPIAPMASIAEAVETGGELVLDEVLGQVYGDKRPPGVTRIVREGSPARVLIEKAKIARLLVVGARGHGHFLLGSVSDRCVHHAECPVVVVRSPVESAT